jgi:hypothetical protein
LPTGARSSTGTADFPSYLAGIYRQQEKEYGYTDTESEQISMANALDTRIPLSR